MPSTNKESERPENIIRCKTATLERPVVLTKPMAEELEKYEPPVQDNISHKATNQESMENIKMASSDKASISNNQTKSGIEGSNVKPPLPPKPKMLNQKTLIDCGVQTVGVYKLVKRPDHQGLLMHQSVASEDTGAHFKTDETTKKLKVKKNGGLRRSYKNADHSREWFCYDDPLNTKEDKSKSLKEANSIPWKKVNDTMIWFKHEDQESNWPLMITNKGHSVQQEYSKELRKPNWYGHIEGGRLENIRPPRLTFPEAEIYMK